MTKRHQSFITNSIFALAFVTVWLVGLVFAHRLDRIETQRQLAKVNKADLSANAIVRREFTELPPPPAPPAQQPVEVVPGPRADDLVSPAITNRQDAHVGVGQHRPQVKREVPKPRHDAVPLPRSRPCPVAPYCTDFGG